MAQSCPSWGITAGLSWGEEKRGFSTSLVHCSFRPGLSIKRGRSDEQATDPALKLISCDCCGEIEQITRARKWHLNTNSLFKEGGRDRRGEGRRLKKIFFFSLTPAETQTYSTCMLGATTPSKQHPLQLNFRHPVSFLPYHKRLFCFNKKMKKNSLTLV